MHVFIVDKVTLTSGVDHSMSVEVAMGKEECCVWLLCKDEVGKGLITQVCTKEMGEGLSILAKHRYALQEVQGRGSSCLTNCNTHTHTHTHTHTLAHLSKFGRTPHIPQKLKLASPMFQRMRGWRSEKAVRSFITC